MVQVLNVTLTVNWKEVDVARDPDAGLLVIKLNQLYVPRDGIQITIPLSHDMDVIYPLLPSKLSNG